MLPFLQHQEMQKIREMNLLLHQQQVKDLKRHDHVNKILTEHNTPLWKKRKERQHRDEDLRERILKLFRNVTL